MLISLFDFRLNVNVWLRCVFGVKK